MKTSGEKVSKSPFIFLFDMVGILLLFVGLSIILVTFIDFPSLNSFLYRIYISIGGIVATIGIILLVKSLIEEQGEEQEIEDEIGREPIYFFQYTVIFLSFLLLSAFVFICFNYSILIKNSNELNWLQKSFISIWFAMLGTVAISFKGASDHWKNGNKNGNKKENKNENKNDTQRWGLWYIERPFNGFIIGVMTYIILNILSANEPTLAVLAGSAFILGLQEKKFFEKIKELSKLILTTKEDMIINSVQPEEAVSEDTLTIAGTELTGAKIFVAHPLEEVKVSPDGNTATGKLPDGEETEIIAIGPDGTAQSIEGEFKYKLNK